MASKRKGIYSDGHERVSCIIRRVGSQNTRIVLEDGTEKLVASELVEPVVETIPGGSAERIIPKIPLETVYRRLRKLTGTKEEKFESVVNVLTPPNGPKGAEFLAAIFHRSVRHAESYSNIKESFYPQRVTRTNRNRQFAKKLVAQLDRGLKLEIDGQTVQMVDYEVFPFRTTKSCHEDGRPATRAGSGGMDLLLASDVGGVLPAVGEIKAASETVGPTFALVQSLMYAAQLTTSNQFLRLKGHYGNSFRSIKTDAPQMDVIVLLEASPQVRNDDLSYALSLAEKLTENLCQYLRNITFLWCDADGDSIACKRAKAE